MSEGVIAGADFSGAKQTPNNTWLAVGVLSGTGLDLLEVKQVGSHALASELSSRKGMRAAGIDCPFSLPVDFLDFLSAKLLHEPYNGWQKLAEDLVFMSFDDFLKHVAEFKKEPKRIADKELSAVSPLHRGNPSMVQMTYQGIRLLAALDPKRFYVSPFQDQIDFGCQIIEVYPRALLKFFSLPEVGYKGTDDKNKCRDVRHKIIDGLLTVRDRKGVTFASCPRLNVNKKLQSAMLESDHALDAVLSCYTTAIFIGAPQLFTDPFALDDINVLLEGWIYAPKLVV